MFKYPKKLRKKDLKKISKYPCSEEIKDAYLKYLTPYSFDEFVQYCNENNEKSMDELIFSFADLQLEKFEPNSLIWVFHVMVNFMIYADVNRDYGEYYDSYVSTLQLTLISCEMKMLIDKISFDEIPFPGYSKISFDKLFAVAPDFKFNLKKDCDLVYKSFHEDFDFTIEEFYLKVKEYFDEKGY